MEEKGKFSDAFNSLNGNLDLRMAVLENSNKLKEMGIDSPAQIERLYKSGDFLAFNDPLKLKNLEMFGIDNEITDQILVAEVMDRTRGHKAYQFVNISDTDKMKRGDILTLDPEKEGKESGTEFQEAFEEYCMNIVKEKIPNIDKVASKEEIMKALGINTYEDVVYMSAKSGGLREHILNKVGTLEDRANFVKELNADKSELSKEENEVSEEEKESQENEQEQEQEDEGMTIEEASEVLGIEEEKLREVAGDDGKILGIKRTGNIEALSRQLGVELSGTNSDVVLLKVAGPGIKSQGLVLNNDGSQVYTPEDGDTTLITELVEDGSNGDYIDDIDKAIEEKSVESKKIETIDPVTGKTVVEFAEKGNEKAVAGYESESKQLLKELSEKIKIIEEGPGEKSDKLTMIADVIYNAKGRLGDLQVAYNIQEVNNLDTLENQAGEYAAEAEVESAKETAGDVVAGVVSGLGVAMFGKEKNAEDDEEHPFPTRPEEHKLPWE